MIWDGLAVHHPDETFQYLGQAHKLVTGIGIDTWEQHEGIRGRLIPQILTLPMWVGSQVSADGIVAYWSMRVFGAALALLIVPAAFAIGQAQDRATAVAMAMAVAIWPYVADLSSHVLSETIGGAVALSGIAFALHAKDDPRRWAVAGLLLGLAVLLRIQFAIFIAVCVLGMARFELRAWRGLIVGGFAAAVIGAASDVMAGATPFVWIARTYHFNIVEHRAATFGVSGPGFYFTRALFALGVAIPFLVMAARWLPAQFRPLVLAVIADIAFLSLVGHKELRFAYLSYVSSLLLAIAATIGAVSTIAILRPSSRVFVLAWIWGLALALAWYVWPYPRWPDAVARLAVDASRNTATCGIAVPRSPWSAMNVAALPRSVPIYSAFENDGPTFASIAKAANVWIAIDGEPVPAGFTKDVCLSGPRQTTCSYERGGECGRSPHTLQDTIDRHQTEQFARSVD